MKPFCLSLEGRCTDLCPVNGKKKELELSKYWSTKKLRRQEYS